MHDVRAPRGERGGILSRSSRRSAGGGNDGVNGAVIAREAPGCAQRLECYAAQRSVAPLGVNQYRTCHCMQLLSFLTVLLRH
ncbi:hypothetical protein D3C78_1652860 [compost metagenome]